jgi:hypothetical protein
MVNTTTIDSLLLAKQAIKETWQVSGFCHACGDVLGDGYEHSYCAVYAKTRDSDYLYQSNYDAYKQLLNDAHVRFYELHFNHWGCGWIDQLVIKAINKNGKVSKAFMTCLSIQEQLDNYPVLDEDDYSNREYDATIESIHDNLPGDMIDNLPDNFAESIFNWLWSHNIYAEECYFDRKDTESACHALGYIKE